MKGNTLVSFVPARRVQLFGKNIERSTYRALLTVFASLCCVTVLAQTTVTPVGGKTSAFLANNGVPVVDIDTPNASGLSHNRYTQFNIEGNGLILNNGDLSRIERQSVLGGRIPANPNLLLGREANLILNEVTSTNPSVLAGFLEVLGGRADVVVVNPNGLTCQGCGFINTDRVTLATGAPSFSSAGSLSGFDVNQGEILITGAGANLGTQDIFDLVARKVKVDGRINTKTDGELKISAGKQLWNYINREVSPDSTVGSASGFAFDSTVLGGMYAGRIAIVTTDNGAGVRMLGEVAANAEDFVLTSAGKIAIKSKISAQRDVQLISTSATGSADIFIEDTAQLSAKRDLGITANTGEVRLREGALYAGRNLVLAADSLSDFSNNENVQRYASNNNQLRIQGSAIIHGTNWSAGNSLVGTFGNLALGSVQSKLSANASLNLTAAQNLVLGSGVVRGDNVSLTATRGLISTEKAAGQGIEAAGGNLSLTAGGGVINIGVMTAASNAIIRTNGTLQNNGSLHAKNNLDIANKNGGNLAIENSGLLVAEGRLQIDARSLDNKASGRVAGNGILVATSADLSNAGVLQGSAKKTQITVGKALKNSGTLTVTASEAGVDESSTIEAESVENSGRLQAANSLDIAAQTISNKAVTGSSSAGVVTSAKDLTIRVSGAALTNAGDITAGKNLHIQKVGSVLSFGITNEGRLQAAKTLLIDGDATGNAAIVINNRAGGSISGDALAFKINTLSNADLVQGGSKASSIGMSGALGNTGTITLATAASGSGAISAERVINSSRIQSLGGASIHSVGDIENSGVLHAVGNLDLRTVNGKITNTGTGGVSSLNRLTVSSDTSDVINQGAFYAQDTLTVNALHGLVKNDTTGTMDAGNDIFISSNNFVNKNTIKAGKEIVIHVGNIFSNITPSAYSIVSSTTIEGPTQIAHRPKGYLFGGVDHYEEFDYKIVTTTTQRYDGGVPRKPQILAGSDLKISGFTDGKNIGGLLSAKDNLTLAGAEGSTFENNALDLIKTVVTETYTLQTRYAALGPAVFHRNRRINEVTTTTRSVLPEGIGAGITASTLTASGFALQNKGSPNTPDISATTTTVSTVSLGASGVQGAADIVFPGLDLSLPSNPNGFFVAAQASSANFLVELNPLFAVGAPNTLGSDYLQERYGYNPETTLRRLGDASYEGFLIRQQLVEQTGSNTLTFGIGESRQIQQLMDSAVAEGRSLGLTYGQALTLEQVAGLTKDIVWMVEVEVGNETVLAPVVYLSLATKQGIQHGAVLAAKDIDARLDSLTNVGGTITATGSLTVQSKDNITNTSGTISGGAVNLTSTGGSIVNETATTGSGNEIRFVTDIGETADITATGNLNIAAQKDIVVKGANISSAGNAAFEAGDAIAVETIVDKTTNSSFTASGVSLLDRQSEKTNITTEKNIGSALAVAGGLSLGSGGDTTLAGSEVTVGQDLDANAEGGFNVISVQDKTTTKSTTVVSGAGVGGGAIGTETKEVDAFAGENVKSVLTVGKNASVNTQKDITVQGSDVNIVGNADIKAENIEILDGLDERSSTTTAYTTTLFKADIKGQADAQAEVISEAGAGEGYAVAAGSVSANVEASGEAALKLFEVSTEVTKSKEKSSVASTLNIGGDLSAQARGALTVQGSNIEAGDNLELDAENVEILAGRSKLSTETSRDATSLGVVLEGSVSAGIDVGAEAQAGSAALPFGVGVSAGAEVGVDANAALTVGVRNEKATSSAVTVTHTGSTLKTGNDLVIRSEEEIEFVGSSAESGSNLVLESQDITSTAAQDTVLETSTQDTHTVGLYVDGDAGAGAGASADLQTLRAEAGAGASAAVSAGLRYQYEGESTTSGSTTRVTSNFKAGNNVTRKAEGGITDQGTQITAGNNIDQSAREITETAANDSVFSATNTSSHDTKIGAQANAVAAAGGKASVININGPKAEADAEIQGGVGGGVRYSGNETAESESATTAVISKYQAGGNIRSASKEATSLIGTELEAGGDLDLVAGTLDYQAAENTSSTNSNAHDINADVRVDAVTITGTPAAGIAAGYQGSGASAFSTESTVGNITTDGSLNIKIKNDTSLEGVRFTIGGNADIQAGGSVDFTAARNTSESLSQAGGIGGEVGAAIGELSVGIESNYSLEKSSSNQAVAGSIQSDGILNISAGQDITLEGTDVQVESDIGLAAAGDINLDAAKNTGSNVSFDLSVSVDVGTSSEKNPAGTAGATSASVVAGGPCAKPPCTGTAEKTSGFDVQTGFGYSEKVESAVTDIKSGGSLTISSQNVIDQEAQLNAQGLTEISGNIIEKEAEQKDISVSGRFGLEGEKVKALADRPTSGNSSSDKLLETSKEKIEKIGDKFKPAVNKPARPGGIIIP